MLLATEAKPVPTIDIRSLRPGEDGTAFRTLNEEWIRGLFTLEPHDIKVLSDPEGQVLAGGGQVFFVYRDEIVVGCVALIAMGDGLYELSKMAVSPTMRGQGIGRLLLQHAVAEARSIGATALYLGSSTKLANAVHLYESIGFKHVPPETLPPAPYSRANVYMKMVL